MLRRIIRTIRQKWQRSKHSILLRWQPNYDEIDKFLLQPLPHAQQLLSLLPSSHTPVVILDIGACEGLDSIRYARLFPNSRIFAFEPVRKNFRRAQALVKRFAANNVSIHQLALSDTHGTSVLYCSSGCPEPGNASGWDYGNKSSSLLEPNMEQIRSAWNWLKFEDRARVQLETLEHFCIKQHVGPIFLMHMDVQGAELMVLRGAGDVLRQTRAIWLEVSSTPFYVGQPFAGEIADFLIRHGFELVLQIGEGQQWDELWVAKKIA